MSKKIKVFVSLISLAVLMTVNALPTFAINANTDSNSQFLYESITPDFCDK